MISLGVIGCNFLVDVPILMFFSINFSTFPISRGFVPGEKKQISLRDRGQFSSFRTSDGGKPEIFQNPGFGFNPGFEIKNPGFSGSKLLVIRDPETGQ